MIIDVFNTFVSILGRCAASLFNLPITNTVSVGSFLVAAAVLSVVIGVVFAGIRSMVAFNNNDYSERMRQERREMRASSKKG